MTRVFAASLMMFVGSLSMAHADLAPLQSLGAASDSAPLASQALDSAAVTPSSPRAITLASNDSDSMMDRMSTLASQTVRKFSQAGLASWYGRQFNGRKTASGQRFNPGAMTMAHPSLPFGTLVRVTHLKNHRSVVLRVNDRGPSTADRVGDVSAAAMRKLGFRRSGVAMVKLEVVGHAKARHHRVVKQRHAAAKPHRAAKRRH